MRWARHIGSAGRLVAASRHPGRAPVPDRARAHTAGRAGRRAGHQERPRRLWRATSRAHRVLTDPRRRDLYFGAEDGTVYALNAKNGDMRWTYRDRRRGQERARAQGRQALLRRLRGQASTRCAPPTAASSGRPRPRERGSASPPAASTATPPCRIRPRLHRQRRRLRLLVLGRQTASWRGGRRPTATSTPRRPSGPAPRQSRPSSSAPTTAPSTRWTRARAPSAGRYGRRRDLRRLDRCSATRSGSPTSRNRRSYALDARTGKQIFELPQGRLRDPDHRQADAVPRRLRRIYALEPPDGGEAPQARSGQGAPQAARGRAPPRLRPPAKRQLHAPAGAEARPSALRQRRTPSHPRCT